MKTKALYVSIIEEKKIYMYIFLKFRGCRAEKICDEKLTGF